MKRLSIPLVKIHKSFDVSFCVFTDGEETEQKEPWGATMQRYSYNGNDYFRVRPRASVCIDISNKREVKREGWTSALQVYLNQRSLFTFKQRLRELIHTFRSVKELFVKYDTGELEVDQALAVKYKKLISTNSGKMILLQACVVTDEESREITYEGCIFAINRMEYFTYLTYEEMLLLYDVIAKVNMPDLALQLLQMDTLHQMTNHEEKKELVLRHPEQGVVEEEYPKESVYAGYEAPEIPEI